ncbi:hypothetical protein BDP27DRAFT_1369879 [Rhodocollybia butyracea]|uniref:Uncharacterized protein n=1 Tax=Rhodocollybia butyracea TaxID=206335 RepID=A0A9P5PC83_9AGAR|nr:hypothetical protein BDP27DRAFT_1369879 [Rhodocollybia butyracea]
MQLKVVCLYLLATLMSTSIVCAAPPGQRPPHNPHSGEETASVQSHLTRAFATLKAEHTGASVQEVLDLTSFKFHSSSVPALKQPPHKYIFKIKGGKVCVPSCLGWYVATVNRIEVYYPTTGSRVKFGVLQGYHPVKTFDWEAERKQFFDAVKPLEKWNANHDKEKCFECLCGDHANPPRFPHEVDDWSHLDIKPHIKKTPTLERWVLYAFLVLKENRRPLNLNRRPRSIQCCASIVFWPLANTRPFPRIRLSTAITIPSDSGES